MNSELEKLSSRWKQITVKAKNTEFISSEELFEIFRDTHKAFVALRSSDSVPRKACQIIMLTDEFTYFAAMGDENYLGDICEGLYRLNYGLKSEFFRGEYQSEFFMGAVPPTVSRYIQDIENIGIDDFVCFLKGGIGEE